MAFGMPSRSLLSARVVTTYFLMEWKHLDLLSPSEAGKMRNGVADGSRTRYLRSHNPVLYLVSYSHHREAQARSLPH